MYSIGLREESNQVDQEEKQRIFQFIRGCLAEMDIDQSELRMDSLLTSELGMSSLDLLDLSYRLEEKYHISLPISGIRERIREIIPDEEFSKEGLITNRGLELLKEMFQGDVKGMIKPGLGVNSLSDLFSIETLVDLTISQIKQLQVK